MKLRVRDVISHQGRDYVVEGVISYKIDGKVYPLARAVDGSDVIFVEPSLGTIEERLLMFREIDDLDVHTPPPETLSYKGVSYLPRLTGKAAVAIEGRIPDREPGDVEVWRFRASGDRFIQVESWAGRTLTLAGEAVHKGMIDILPGPDAGQS